MKQLFIACTIVLLAGLVIVILPDGGDRVITFSERHGPSFVDLVGLSLIVGSWIIMMIHAIVHWPDVLQMFGRRLVSALIVVAMGGFMVIVVSIRSDSYVWWLGAGLSALAQFALMVPSFRQKR